MTHRTCIPDTTEKTMSATPAEFQRSMVVLDPSCPPTLAHRFICGTGTITVTYAALPTVTLGTLLALPRARVTVQFDDVPQPARVDFMARFDIAFQRGGG